jgi:outer membrane protein assembly factor BamB
VRAPPNFSLRSEINIVMIRRIGRFSLIALSLVTLLAGCETLGLDEVASNKPDKLPGERISVLQNDQDIKPDEGVANDTIRLPRPWINANWPQNGGYPDHSMQHVELGDHLQEAWKVSIGDGSDGRVHLLAPPVIDHGRVFTIDARSQVSAFSAKDGTLLWQLSVAPPDASAPVTSGGIAIGANRLYVASGFAQIVSLEADTGKEVWRQNTQAPLRAAPTISGDRLFVVTVDNEVLALLAADGSKIWSHTGLADVAGLLGGASPAVDSGVVVAPTNTGELFALRSESGRLTWSDNLTAIRHADAVSALADISGRPVIDHGAVYALSHSGRVASIDLRTGDQIWEREIGGEHQPWVAGDFLYLLSVNQELFCLIRGTGQVRWTQALQRWEGEEKKSDKIVWAGPVLAGDRLIVVGTNAMALSVSPYTGQTIGQIDLPGPAHIPPVVADRTLYILTDDGDLLAYR